MPWVRDWEQIWTQYLGRENLAEFHYIIDSQNKKLLRTVPNVIFINEMEIYRLRKKIYVIITVATIFFQ